MGSGAATVITIGGPCPHIPRAARAGAGGCSAGAAPTPIRAAAPGELACRRSPGCYAPHSYGAGAQAVSATVSIAIAVSAAQ